MRSQALALALLTCGGTAAAQPPAGRSRTEITCTGMARVAWSALRRSATSQPSVSGSSRSSVIASGRLRWASMKPSSPLSATSVSKPRSRASVCITSVSFRTAALEAL